MAFFIFFVLFVFPFLQAGPLDNWGLVPRVGNFHHYPAHCHCSALHLIYARKRQRQQAKLNLNVQVKGGVSDDRRRHCALHGSLVRPLYPHWLHLITAPTTDLSTNLH